MKLSMVLKTGPILLGAEQLGGFWTPSESRSSATPPSSEPFTALPSCGERLCGPGMLERRGRGEL